MLLFGAGNEYKNKISKRGRQAAHLADSAAPPPARIWLRVPARESGPSRALLFSSVQSSRRAASALRGPSDVRSHTCQAFLLLRVHCPGRCLAIDGGSSIRRAASPRKAKPRGDFPTM